MSDVGLPVQEVGGPASGSLPGSMLDAVPMLAAPRLVAWLALLTGFQLGCAGAASEGSPNDSTAIDETRDVAPDVVVVRKPLRVLFIGNSYTYVNDIPRMIRTLGETAGVPPRIESEEVTVGGARLADHWTTGTAQQKIALGGFHYVVLQGQSLEPVFSPESFADYATRFANEAVKVNARPTLYVTWARAPGDGMYAFTETGGTPDALQDRLTKSYGAVAAKFPTALVVKVGEAFRASLAARPTLALHVEDRSHPSVAGSYLAACTFYVALSGHAVPAIAAAPSGVTADEAAFLKGIAASVR